MCQSTIEERPSVYVIYKEDVCAYFEDKMG